MRIHIQKLGSGEFKIRTERTRRRENRNQQVIARSKDEARAQVARLVREMRGESPPA